MITVELKMVPVSDNIVAILQTMLAHTASAERLHTIHGQQRLPLLLRWISAAGIFAARLPKNITVVATGSILSK